MWSSAIKLAARRLPKMVSPRAHSALDYAMAGSFLVAGVVMWRRNKRAALGALVCGGVKAANILVTDYPGGKYDVLSYRTHGRVDAGIAGLAAAMPRVMGFQDDDEAGFFALAALSETVVASLTDFNQDAGDDDEDELGRYSYTGR